MHALIASIPSPARSELHLGPFPLRGYALMIILGVVFAVVTGEYRLRRLGYRPGVVADIALWAVPFGLLGGRLYHVITDNQLYFRSGQDWVRAFYIWDGGLGIWGAVALGAVGAYIGCRQQHVQISQLGDAIAPGILAAQGIGRWGNWFNQELYGRPSNLPWAVHIDLAHRLPQYANIATYQPTFLYEFVWDVLGAGFVVLAERYRWFGRLSRGRAFALYVAVYTVGRGWIEYLRVDEAHRFFGLRLNDYTAIILFVLAVGYLLRVRPYDGDTALPPGAPRAQDEPGPEAAAPTPAPAAVPAGDRTPGPPPPADEVLPAELVPSAAGPARDAPPRVRPESDRVRHGELDEGGASPLEQLARRAPARDPLRERTHRQPPPPGPR